MEPELDVAQIVAGSSAVLENLIWLVQSNFTFAFTRLGWPLAKGGIVYFSFDGSGFANLTWSAGLTTT